MVPQSELYPTAPSCWVSLRPLAELAQHSVVSWNGPAGPRKVVPLPLMPLPVPHRFFPHYQNRLSCVCTGFH